MWHEFAYAPIKPDFTAFTPLSNTAAVVRMKLPAGIDPIESLIALIEAGPGAPTGANVEVEFFAQMLPSTGGARMIVADDEPIVAYDLKWNGIAGYADLTSGNVTQYSAGNGWSVVQTVIPLTDFDMGTVAWNGGTVTVQSASAPAPKTVTAEYQTFNP